MSRRDPQHPAQFEIGREPGEPASCPRVAEIEEELLAVDGEQAWAELVAHLDACPTCRQKVSSGAAGAALADDVRWAQRVREKISVDVNVPLARLNAVLTDYELLEEIGRGGMGIVFKARHLRLDRVVALKVLPALLGVVRPDARKRFEREATLAARLEHTNIISVYDFGQVDGTMYYAMQLIEGRSLREVLREIDESGAIDTVIGGEQPSETSKSPKVQKSKEEAVSTQPSAVSQDSGGTSGIASEIPQSAFRDPKSSLTRIGSSHQSDRAYFRRVAEWIADVAEALHYAHGLGVIHRDIKPSNLLLAGDSRLMISDFGLAKASNHQSITMSRSLLGTCRYMSPEQVDEALGPIDHRVDIYALGATLYELLTFKPMFAAADDREVLNQVLNKDPTPPHRYVRQIPRELDTICLKAVEKDRDRRYDTAVEMAKDLRRWLLDMPIQAQRPSLSTRAVKLVRRRKGLAAAVVTSALLLVTSGVLYAGYRQAHRQAVEARQVAGSKHVRLVIYEAQQDFDNGRHEAGLMKLDDALADHPDEIELQVNRARFLNHLQRHEEAAGYLEGVLARDPERWEAHFQLALVYRSMGADAEKLAYHAEQAKAFMPADSAWTYYVQALSEPDAQKAVELADKAIELDPTDIGPVLYRCARYKELGRFEDMLSDAERAVAMRPRWAITHGQRGCALLNLERYEEAERDLSRAIELDPSWIQWWGDRAETRRKLERYDQALSDGEEALKLDPDRGIAYAIRGSARAGVGDLEGCLADFERAIELMPDHAMYFIRRASILSKFERWDEVICDATRASELEPDNALYHYNLGAVYLHTRQYAEAIPPFTRAIELAPDKLLYPHARGAALIQLLRLEEAIADLSTVLAKEARNVVVLVQRGMAYELGHESALAIKDYRKAAVLDDPERSFARLWWYILLRQEGQDEAAADLLTSPAAHGNGIDLVDRICELFSDRLSAEALLGATDDDDEERSKALYYVARKSLLDNQIDEARRAFAESAALGQPGNVESDFARARLKLLQAIPNLERKPRPSTAPDATP